MLLPTASHPNEPQLREPRLPTGVWVAVAIALLLLLWMIWNGQALAAFKREAGPFSYFAAMAVLPALGVPLTPMFMVAGATFGTRIGIVGSLLALSANLLFCYWIAQSALRPFIVAKVARLGFELPNFDEQERGALRFTLIVKLMPGVPAFLKNYLLGLAGVPFVAYFVISLAFTGLYGFALLYLGDSLREHDIGHLTIAALVLIAALLLLRWWRRREQP